LILDFFALNVSCSGSKESGQEQIRREAKRSIFEYLEMYYNQIWTFSALNYKPPWILEGLAGLA